MTWLKTSDTAAQHPVVLAPLAWDHAALDGLDAADLLHNALFGLVNRCAVHSAAYDSDYVVPDAVVAVMAAPAPWRPLADLAARAGYWTRLEDRGGWLLLDDSEHLFHIRLKAEKAWEAQRRKDNGNPALIVPVRLRDGDGCRHCGKIVNWRARRGGRAGTYDHRVPGQAAQGPDDLVVSCGWCNSKRGDSQAESWTPLPAPTTPHYGEDTVALLAEHAITVPLSGPPRPARQADPARTDRDPAPSQAAHPDLRPARQADPAHPADVRQPGPPVPVTPLRPAGQADPAHPTPATRPPGGHRAAASLAAYRTAAHRTDLPGPARKPSPGYAVPAGSGPAPPPDLPEPAGKSQVRQIGSVPDLTVSGRDGIGSGRGGAGGFLPAPRRARSRRGRTTTTPPSAREQGPR